MAVLGRVPAVGDQVAFDGLRLSVHAMDGRRISRVRLSRTDSAGGGERPAQVAEPQQG